MRLEDAPDALLAMRSTDGDEQAFGVLVRRHAPFLRAFATRYLRSTAEVDDVVQDCLIKAWQRLDTLKDPAQFRSWVTTAVARRATDVLRTRARRGDGELPYELPDRREARPEHVVERSVATRALHDAVEALPEAQRQVWVLREIAGLSYEEIAERLGESVSTVRGRLARARATLVDAMESWR